jgi:hypothetical protein
LIGLHDMKRRVNDSPLLGISPRRDFMPPPTQRRGN